MIFVHNFYKCSPHAGNKLTLKRHLKRADWFFRVLADDAAQQEDKQRELAERERLVRDSLLHHAL